VRAQKIRSHSHREVHLMIQDYSVAFVDQDGKRAQVSERRVGRDDREAAEDLVE
jgi:hypothetical protein